MDDGSRQRDTFWIETARGLAAESVRSIEEAARQVIAIASLAQAAYFAAVSFSRAHEALARYASGEQIIIALALVSPLVCWVISLYFAVRVFKPETYQTNLDSPELAESLYREVVAYKRRKLQAAYWFLVLGFAPLIASVVMVLLVF